jgi:hypothetical protein
MDERFPMKTFFPPFLPTNVRREREKLPDMVIPRMTAKNLTMYPTSIESNVIREAEAFMEESMARYDPSHDAHHGQPGLSYYLC